MQKDYDVDVIASLGWFIIAGLNPGGFGTSLMMQDKEMCYARAHRHLHPGCPYTNGQDVVANMMEFVNEHFPSSLLADHTALQQWENQQGLLGADENTKMMLHIQNGDSAWYLRWISPRWRPFVQGKVNAEVPSDVGVIWRDRILSR